MMLNEIQHHRFAVGYEPTATEAGDCMKTHRFNGSPLANCAVDAISLPVRRGVGVETGRGF